MRTLATRFRPDWRTALSALLIVLSFPPYNLHWLIWIALIPWFQALYRAKDSRAATLQGLWLSVLMSIGGFHWVAYVLKTFANLPWAVAIVGLLLYSLIGQPQFYLVAAIHRQMQRRRNAGNWIAPLSVGLAYAGIDWILPKLFVDTLGHSQYLATWLRQAADLAGAPLLTVLIYLVNDALWETWRRLRERKEPSAWPALTAAGPALLLSFGLLSALTVYGRSRYLQLAEYLSKPGPHVQLAVIQANIGDIDKLAAESGLRNAAEKILSTYYSLSEVALTQQPRPEMIIWPETAYPSTFRTPMNSIELQRDQDIESFVHRNGVPLLFGGYDTRDGKDFNAFFFLSDKKKGGLDGNDDLQIYRKNVLLPFGEFIPFAEDIRFVREMFPQVGYFGRGKGPEVFSQGGVNFGPIICYEALFPNYILRALHQGSQVILNITNDSWFGPYGEPQLHLALSAFRSIESRLPQLRATNTGISALITADGTIESPTPIFQPAILNVSVNLAPPLWTLMAAWGDWFGPTALFLGLVGVALFVLGNPRKRSD